MDEKEKVLFAEINVIAQQHDLQCRAILNLEGGRGWINYSKIEENDYLIQISTPDNFDAYKATRDALTSTFSKYNAVLSEERDYKQRAFGFQKELVYMDKAKYDAAQQKKEQTLKRLAGTTIGTQITGDVHTEGGNLNTGDAKNIDNSSSHIEKDDKRWFQKEVVKTILTFIGGVGATIIAEWLMRLLGWIS